MWNHEAKRGLCADSTLNRRLYFIISSNQKIFTQWPYCLFKQISSLQGIQLEDNYSICTSFCSACSFRLQIMVDHRKQLKKSQAESHHIKTLLYYRKLTHYLVQGGNNFHTASNLFTCTDFKATLQPKLHSLIFLL